MMNIRILFLLLFSGGLHAQNMQTDIYLMRTQWKNDTLDFSLVTNMTSGHKGYDNQPWFTPDGKHVLFTSMTADSTTDIFLHELRSGKNYPITETPLTSEYSPRYMPGGKRMQVVRVEEDRTSQRLWSFTRNGLNPRLEHPVLDSVGYYEFSGDTGFMVFVLGPDQIHTLRYCDGKNQNERLISDSVGRSFIYVSGDVFSEGKWIGPSSSGYYFTRNSIQGNKTLMWWEIKDEKNAKPLCVAEKLPDLAEDLFLFQNMVFCTAGENIFRWDAAEKLWRQQILRGASLKGMTRVSVHPGGKTLAVVASEQ